MRPPASGLVCMLSVGPSMGERGRSELFGMSRILNRRDCPPGRSLVSDDLTADETPVTDGRRRFVLSGRGASMLKLLSEKLRGRGGVHAVVYWE